MGKTKKQNIEELEWELRYERFSGMTTRSMCECGERMCRRYKCEDCILKEIAEFR